MTDIVTLSPGCEYCAELAELHCDHCGAYVCIDHVEEGACPGCWPMEDTPVDLPPRREGADR